MQLNTLKKILLEIFLPQFCLICKKQGTIICLDCLSTIEIIEQNFCPFCSSPHRTFEKGKCDKHRAKALNGLFFATSYAQPVVKKLIARFKYEPYIKNLSQPLAYLIIAHFAATKNEVISTDTGKAILVPIPSRGKRQRERGYNQSTEIAKDLSYFLDIPLAVNNLVKIKNTKPQVGLSRKEREQNLENVFSVKYPQLIKHKTILLVDDVFTTGSTMEHAAKTLKLAGAHQVWGVAVAREPFIHKPNK